MDVLYGIPILGLFIQFVAYIIQIGPNIAPIVLAISVPLAFGALCGIMNERSGVVNIGIEGMMLMSAFFGFVAAGFAAGSVDFDTSGPFGVTPPILLGVAVAVGVAVLLSVLHAWLSITIRTDQIISGTIINIAALGLTGYLNRIFISPNPRLGAGTFQTWRPPEFLTDLPVVGWLFNMFLKQGPIAMSLIVFVIVLQVLLFRSRWGLRTRAVGEHPRAADTVGISVFATRYAAVITSGALAALGGAYLSLASVHLFDQNLTGGRGFIAIAALIFGNWRPFGAMAACLLFGFSSALGDRLPAYFEQGSSTPLLFNALPYVLTLIAVAGVIGRSIPPAAIGRPYRKQ
jgi:general nucleoside transport system permease protein